MEIINKFSLPAPFDEQRYSADTGGVEKRTINFVIDETSEAFIFKDNYVEHYGF